MVCSATRYDIGGDTSLDCLRTVISLAKINVIPFMCTSRSSSLYIAYRRDNWWSIEESCAHDG